MAQSKNDSTEMHVILPLGEYRSLEQRANKAEITDNSTMPTKNEDEKSDEEPLPPTQLIEKTSSPPKEEKKELKNNYRFVQIKKLLNQIKRLNPSQDITSLPNLDELVKSALGNSRKVLGNEAKFFNFLFDNNLAHFVKNRNKIKTYYKFSDNWWAV